MGTCRITVVLSLIAALVLIGVRAEAFSQKGPEADCKKCHTLSAEEATSILGQLGATQVKVLEVSASPLAGLWEVSVEDRGRGGLVYIDFSKKYLVSGSIIEVATKANKSAEKMQKVSEEVQKIQDSKRIDLATIPLNEAIVMGDPKAPKKVIIFTDPDCPFCDRLHTEVKKVLETRKDIVFYLKLYPLPMHKDAYWKSKAIVCKKSVQMLEDNFAKKPIEKAECDTKEIDDNLKLAEKLGISGTPAIILPDGRLRSGAMQADQIIKLVDEK